MGKKKNNKELNPVSQKNTYSERDVSSVGDNNNRFQLPQNIANYIQNFKWTEFRETLINVSIILLVLCILVFTVILRAGEELYGMNGKLNKNENQKNYYEILGVSKKSSNLEIKKAFRKLSLVWHPDKNPDCEPCLEKFRDISKAYEILGDDEKRQIYDTTHGGEIEIIPSAAVTLTSDNFDDLVMLQKTNSWVIQVYTDHDELCHYFSPIWEESIEEMGKYYKFGRIHAKKESSLLKKLPLSVKVFPAIFVITNGYPYELYSKIYDPSLESFMEFLSDSFPTTLSLLNSEKSLATWLIKSNLYKPKILIVSNKPSPSLLIRSFSLKWGATFEFAFFHNKKSKMLSEWGVEQGRPYLVAFSQIVENKDSTPDIIFPLGEFTHENILQSKYINDQVLSIINKSNSLAQKLEKLLLYIQQINVPFIDSSNAKNLCKSNSLNRVICLVILHDELYEWKQNQEVIRALEISRQSYIKSKEGLGNKSDIDNDEADEYIGEIFIQPTQVALSSNVRGIPSISKVKSFVELTRSAPNSGFLLIDFDGDRFTNLETLTDIYQKIFEEEIYWKRLPQFCKNHNDNLYNYCLFGNIQEPSFFQLVSPILKLKNIFYIFTLTISIYFFKNKIKVFTIK